MTGQSTYKQCYTIELMEIDITIHLYTYHRIASMFPCVCVCVCARVHLSLISAARSERVCAVCVLLLPHDAEGVC